MANRPPQFLSLEPVLRCPNPRCGRAVNARLHVELLTITCKHCGAHWWATRLAAGDIRSQMRAAFDGNEVFVELLDTLGAPERVEQPVFWQLWLSGNEHYHLTNVSIPGGILQRSHELVRKLIGETT